MPQPIDLTVPVYCLRLCRAARAFIKRLLTKKHIPHPSHNPPPVSAPQTEHLILAVKFSASLTRRTL